MKHMLLRKGDIHLSSGHKSIMTTCSPEITESRSSPSKIIYKGMRE